MQRTDVDHWLAAYLEAWQSYDPEQIGALFSADAEYRYHPHDEPLRGRDEIARSWAGDRDEPGTWDAEYRTIAVDGDVAVATGHTTYTSEPGRAVERVFDNCFVMRFDADARCSSFTEFYVERPRA